MLKKGISVLLIMVFILSTFTIIPFSVSADTFPNVSGFPDFDMDCYVADLFINPDTTQYNHIIFEMYSKSTNKVMRDRIESNTPMMAGMTAWQVATFQASDTSHDAVTQLGYYESIILSSLNTAMKSKPVKDTFDNAYVKGGKMLFDAFKNILKAEYAITDIDLSDYNSLSAAKQTAYMNSFEKAFKQQHPGTSDLGKFTKIFGTIVKTGKAAEECINLFSSYYHCSLVDDYLCEVVNDMYDQCPDDNATMKTALMNISKACNGSLDNIALDVVYRGFDVIYSTVVDNTINGIIASQPAGLAFMIAQSIGKNVSNFLFSTDAICENYYKICCFDEFEKLVRSVTQYEIDKYKAERTNYNANVLFSAVGLMFEINEISCDISIEYADTIYEKSVAGIFLDKAESDNFKKAVEGIRKIKQETYYLLMSNYIFNLEEDYPEIYAAYMKIMDEIENPVVHVTGINFSKKHMTIGLEDDAWFFWNNAEVTPSNATNRAVSYSTSDDSIVSIKLGNTLMIELHQTGTVTVTATSEDGGFTDTMTIEVVEGHGTDGVYLEDPVTNIKDSGKCGDNVYWNLYNNGTLKIYGNGKMYNYSYYKDTPWYYYTILQVKISDGVTSIGDNAFNYCRRLSKVTIPNSVTSIGEEAFDDCNRLTSVTIPDSVVSIGNGAFDNCSSLTSVIIPDSVASIGNGAFYHCSSLTSVTIGNSVTSIDDQVFYDCSCLTSVTIGNSVRSIGRSAFSGCSSLTEVTIPNSVTSIGEGAFASCTRLTSITIPDSVTSIGDGAFSNCSSLTSMIIPDSVTRISAYVFYDCNSLNSVTIPNSVWCIGDCAFDGCSSLTSVTIPNSVKRIDRSAFYDCSSLTSVTIPDSVTSIGDGAFGVCNSLDSVIISNSVRTIGSSAFCECTSLKSVSIPDSVMSIGGSTFYGCSSLTSVTFGNSVTSIGYQTFAGCSSLTSVTFGNSVKSIGEKAFYGCSSLTNMTIPNSIMSIGYYAFNNCSNLTKVAIPDSVTSIGYNAFGYYYDSSNRKVSGFTIYGYIGSEAERYANDNGFIFIKLTYSTDSTTGIILTVPDGVEKNVEKKPVQEADGALPVGSKAAAVYNITLTKNGETVQPENVVTVKIPCEFENAKVYCKEADGTYTDMNAKHTDGYQVFTTDHLGMYIVAEEKSHLLGDVDGDDNISIVDATFIQRHLANIPIPFEFNEKVSDSDEDGIISIMDATYIQRWLANLKANDNIGKVMK